MQKTSMLKAGAADVDISPRYPVFLAGYPHVERMSEGINDPLLASALFLDNGLQRIVMISLDLLFIDIDFARKLRRETAQTLGIAEANVFISCAHTHSGPLTADVLAFRADPVVPTADQAYMDFIFKKIQEAALAAKNNATTAEICYDSVNIDAVGCNRHDPAFARDPEAGMLVLRDLAREKIFAVAVIYSMHPTVLHEDSRLVSGDFPAFTRMYLQRKLGEDIVVAYHMGPAGNQSPRHHVRAQSIAEARRLGEILGEAVFNKLSELEPGSFRKLVELAAKLQHLELTPKTVGSVDEAGKKLAAARQMYQALAAVNASHGALRTAECAVFGAEEKLFLAQCAADGRLEKYLRQYMPCDIQCLRIGDLCLAGLPGELFVEYALELKKDNAVKTFVISLVNGHLQGYIVTAQAAESNCYEAANSIFSPAAGKQLIAAAQKLTRELFA